MAEQRVGYSILDLRVKELEEKMKDVEKKLKVLAKDKTKGEYKRPD
ncbi:hypothetical protein [Peribacillus frigoritolerans]|nr:hypothetical protein [Peribacillus frigoritolerans]